MKKSRIIACIASFPERKKSLKSVVFAILPQVDHLNVYLNEYDEVPQFLKDEKITVVLGSDAEGDIKDLGKFYFINECQERDYYLTIDDDISYPKDYVEKMIACLGLNNDRDIVGVHGWRFHKSVDLHKNHRTVIHFSQALDCDMRVDVLGTGTCLFRGDVVQKMKLIANEKYVGNADLFIAEFAYENNIPLYVTSRSAGWLSQLERYTRNLFEENSDSLDEFRIIKQKIDRVTNPENLYIAFLENLHRERNLIIHEEKKRLSEKYQEENKFLRKNFQKRVATLEGERWDLKQRIVAVKEANKALEKKQKEAIVHYEGMLKNKDRTLVQLRSSKAFRLGDLFFRSIKSPLKIITFPWNAFQILLGISQSRVSVENRSNEKHSSQGIFEKRHLKDYPVIASSLIDSGYAEKGLSIAKSFTSSEDSSVLHIFHAHASRGDEEKWVHHLNEYFFAQDLAAIKLVGDKQSHLFARFSPRDNLKKISDGPLVTVIMPAYNSEETIGYALRSILSQTWQNLQVLVVDDCSSDRTFEIVSEIAKKDDRVEVFKNKINVGPYVGKNRMLVRARGEYVTGHDADDWAHPERIEKQILTLLQEEKVAILSRMLRIDNQGNVQFQTQNEFAPNGIAKRASISLMIKTDTMREFFGYWDSVKCGADSELIERIQVVMKDQVIIHDLVVMLCLVHGNSLVNDKTIGTNVNGGLSEPRRLYAESFRKWHDSMEINNSLITFPQEKRVFVAPQEIVIKNSDIRAVIGEKA